MARVWPRNAALAKSVPRGSVIVGMRTRRRPSFSAARRSSQRTPASPRLSVSAMTWACVPATQSPAPEKAATLDLVLEREPGHRAELSGEDVALFLAQPHGAAS